MRDLPSQKTATPTSANIRSFVFRPLPSKIIIDTGFLLSLTAGQTGLHKKAQHISDCVDFGKALDENHTKIYVSDWVLNELIHQIHRQKISDWLQGLDGAKRRSIASKLRRRLGREPESLDFYRNNPTIIREAHPIIRKVVSELTKLRAFRDFGQAGPRIRAQALKISRRFDLLITDSFILATAIVNKIPDIATTDIRDFGRVASPLNINIYVPPKLLPSD